MPAYWNQLVGHLSERRSRWIAQHARSRERPSPATAEHDARAAAGSPKAPTPAERENERLKHELAGLRGHVAQLTQLSQTRAEQIDVLVDAVRHLRRHQQRSSGLSYRGASDTSGDSRSSELPRTLSGGWSDSSRSSSSSDELADVIDPQPTVFRPERRRCEASAATSAARPAARASAPSRLLSF